ncbi:hypothetical protein AYO38_04945 [bacterium SCGC AG-212-C10]|nr:hypothetical protein AYO38_04945 [bacterium SCGC AG-212-C10]
MSVTLLEGFTVVEIGHPHTEYAGLILAGLGAEVWLVEAPGGADTRRRGPFAPGVSGSRASVPFLARNGGKKSVVCDPERAGDRSALAALVGRAHVVLEPADSPWAAIVAGVTATPRVTITDDRELGVSSIVAFAASGGLSSSGWTHQPPCNAPGWLALDGAGIYAAVMALVAGSGAPVGYEVPLQEGATAAITPWTRPLHSYGMAVAGQGIGSARLGAGPYPIMPCRDGFIRVLMATPKQWQAWITLLGHPESLTGPEWTTPQFRAGNFDLMVALASDIIAEHTVEYLFSEGQRLGLTVTPVLDPAAFLSDAHVIGRGFAQAVDDPDAGRVLMLRAPVRTPLENGGEGVALAPALGSHTDQATASSGQPERIALAPGAGRLPLAGLRVLSCSVGAVVPECGEMMALLGAEVIKVESRKHVDFLRQVGLGGPGDFNNCPTFNQMNLGIQSLAVDMGTEAGREVVRQLIPHCDMVIENMRGPVMRKWGLDYESVRALRPDVIYLSSQGLGDGPYGDYQTYGPNLQTFSGVTSQWAHPDDLFPVGSTLNHPDHVAGKQALVAVLAALRRRNLTGAGCYLDCAQFETAAYLIADRFLAHQLAPEGAGAKGNHSHDFAPHNVYRCLGEERWVAIAVESDEQWTRFATAIGEPWTQRSELATTAGRFAHLTELDAQIAVWAQRHTADHVESVLRAAGVPASRVVIGDDIAADEQAHASGFYACVPHPTAGARWQTGLPVRDSEGRRFPVKRSPLMGEHDEHVMLDVLGLSVQEASELVASGAVGY